ncbi:MAG: NTP transferase domain-containing protein, partial [Gammaproteobacteria bacterium]|nr:NTP transferase domain-containing protein [Gemmatimonadota bacterium]NIR42158.1 NTP transferase domain-containing protein [Actinomycetota bacterium]NIU80337.1 NTP transferase domain-containing protein [Gammaproteobacteria bacterium]NIX25798.1 NTP transferase domain-containing protein [Actinomycetota bacterium]
DHALVEARHVTELLAAAFEADAPLALPVYGDERGHPAFFRRELFDELLDPALEGGARTVVHRHLEGARLVAMNDPAVVMDIDTPEDYVDALGMSGDGPGAA